jgi:hypothetical protein
MAATESPAAYIKDGAQAPDVQSGNLRMAQALSCGNIFAAVESGPAAAVCRTSVFSTPPRPEFDFSGFSSLSAGFSRGSERQHARRHPAACDSFDRASFMEYERSHA